MRKMIFALFLPLFIIGYATAQDLKYLVYDADLSPPEEYRARRISLMNSLEPGSAAVFYAAPEHTRSNDTEFQYRQNNDFYYFTGFQEPSAILILSANGISAATIGDSSGGAAKEILFVMKKDKRRETWSGRLFGPQGAKEATKIAYATTNDKFADAFASLVSTSSKIYVPKLPQDLHGTMKQLLKPVEDFLRENTDTVRVGDPTKKVREMRSVKSLEEIRLIRKATDISLLAHREAMKECKPTMFEYQLQAVYESAFKKKGAEYTAYPCIVGSGENSVILHYNTSRRQMRSGDVVVADCGAEYHNYATDITRTYPINGKFSQAQREIYEIVYQAQEAAFKEIKPGVPFSNASRRATEVIRDGLLRLGIIKDSAAVRRYFPHGLGHAVGLDVHDPGIPVLEPNVIYTVEPGIYIPEDSPDVDPKYFNIGIRIEDMVLVTNDGYELLSASLPRTIRDIEQLMEK